MLNNKKQYTKIRQFYAWTGAIAILAGIAYALGFISAVLN